MKNKNKKDKKTYSLSIFLLKESLEKDDEAIQDITKLKKTEVKIENEGFDLYSRQNPSHTPSWVNIFKPYTTTDNLNDLSNSGCSAVLLVKNNDRKFALTFGYGHYLLKPDCFEENFGLRVVLNSVDPRKLRCVDAHTLEATPVHKKNQASVSTNFTDFGFDVEQDLMYAATGSPIDKNFCKKLSGKDSLKISLSFDLNDLPILLSKVLELFEAESYKKILLG